MKLITITGPAGSGKDTVARLLADITGYEVLCSYTTRPIREGEKDGREHHFVTVEDVPPYEQMMAYTHYGGYEYWTTFSQIHTNTIYVIDECGLRNLCCKGYVFENFEIKSLFVYADKKIRQKRGVTDERMKRDESRQRLPSSFYDFFINNDMGIDELQLCLSKLVKKAKL